MAFKKITEEDMRGKGNVGQPVTPGVDTAEMQRIMDELAREVIAPTFNKLIDDMKQTTGAAEIGMKAPAGLTGITVQDIVNSLNRKADNHIADKENPHEVTAEQVNAYTKEETNRQIDDKVFQIGAGDMSKSEYVGSGATGVVHKADVASDAELLSGRSIETLAKAENGIELFEASVSGKTISLKGNSNNIKFVAPTNYTDYTFTVNGEAVTASTVSGEPLWPNFFTAGSVVTCYKNGSTLTFNAGGLTAADKETVRANMLVGESILGGSVEGSFKNEISFIIFRGHKFGAAVFTNKPENWDGKIVPGKYRAVYVSTVLRTGVHAWITIDGKTAENGKIYDFASGVADIGLHHSDNSSAPGDIEGAMAISVLRLIKEG